MNRQRIGKELRELGILAAVLLILYFTGLLTHVAAFAQRMVLATGLANPKIELNSPEYPKAVFEFSLTDIDSQLIEFKTFKEKVVFVNFWATWCAPCLAEMPNIADLYEQYQDNHEIAFVMINLDQDREKAKAFVDKKEYGLPVYFLNQSGLPDVYEARTIPTTYIINKNGQIVFRETGMANYDNQNFRNYLNNLLTETTASQ